MEDSFVKFALWAIGLVASGTVAGLIKVWFDLYNFKLKIAEQSPKSKDLDELKGELRELRRVVHDVARKLHVPVTSDD